MKKRITRPKPRLSHIDVGGIVESMARGECSAETWQGFVSSPIEHLELETIRRRCIQLPSLYPPEARDQYCGLEGRLIMSRIADGLFGAPCARRARLWERLITPQ